LIFHKETHNCITIVRAANLTAIRADIYHFTRNVIRPRTKQPMCDPTCGAEWHLVISCHPLSITFFKNQQSLISLCITSSLESTSCLIDVAAGTLLLLLHSAQQLLTNRQTDRQTDRQTGASWCCVSSCTSVSCWPPSSSSPAVSPTTRRPRVHASWNHLRTSYRRLVMNGAYTQHCSCFLYFSSSGET